jgi:hypothetical protein
MSHVFDESFMLDISNLQESGDVLSDLTTTELEKVRGGGTKGGSNIVITGGGFGVSPTIVVSGGGKKGGSNIVVTGGGGFPYPFPFPGFPYGGGGHGGC